MQKSIHAEPDRNDRFLGLDMNIGGSGLDCLQKQVVNQLADRGLFSDLAQKIFSHVGSFFFFNGFDDLFHGPVGMVTGVEGGLEPSRGDLDRIDHVKMSELSDLIDRHNVLRIDHTDGKSVSCGKKRNDAEFLCGLFRDQLDELPIQTIVAKIDIGNPEDPGFDVRQFLLGHQAAANENGLDRLADPGSFFLGFLDLICLNKPLL